MTKAHILEEIKRVAKASGGEPPGEKTFQRETGIKKTDWFGKIWARWSDALREAGFAPNRLQGAYEKTELLDRYAKLANKLGGLPALGDMRLESRSDSKFPSDATFDNRFGSKLELVRQLFDYCQCRDEYKDVARFC